MSSDTTDKSAIRDAATVIALRDRETAPRVLMGQRGSGAAFMPSKFVFPGGALDTDDARVPLARPLPAVCAARLQEDCDVDLSHALAAAAIRELWEETGLALGLPGAWDAPPPDWKDFAAKGLRPSAHALQFVFRAITPPGRPRRFDARFFLVDAGEIAGDLDDFSGAQDELSHLHWVPLAEARALDLPFITEVVLAEVAARAHDPNPPETVPFFRNDDEESLLLRLRGAGHERAL
ncbi:NUDIX hydrolase [Roseovarius salinarum]|uniref:NUDIX hydrolase n=1 Tax=Roseovarius salinarum TaxID=1981892 RepID=UPI000C340DBD|nr:NUDIX hydrolase [Roseovarius salinarum]